MKEDEKSSPYDWRAKLAELTSGRGLERRPDETPLEWHARLHNMTGQIPPGTAWVCGLLDALAKAQREVEESAKGGKKPPNAARPRHRW